MSAVQEQNLYARVLMKDKAGQTVVDSKYTLSKEEKDIVGIYRMLSNEEKKQVYEHIIKIKIEKNKIIE